MPVPRSQAAAVVVSSVASVALVLGGLAILTGTRAAEPAPSVAIATSTPEASIAGVSAAPEADDMAARSARDALPLGPVDSSAIFAGLRRGGYRFTVHTIGFPSFAAATPLETGIVPDAEHYVLDWPDSTFISRYVRDGNNRTAWLGDAKLNLVPGDGWERTPDEMLPADFYAAAITPWLDTLPGGSADGTYAAEPEVLTSKALDLGVAATAWELSVRVDGRERLVAARFEGAVRGRRFLMDITVTYEDPVGGGIVPGDGAPDAGRRAGDAGDDPGR